NAFATGQDVYFGQGKFQPNTPQGKQLIAHELAHTIQQKDAPVARQAKAPDEAEAKPAPTENAQDTPPVAMQSAQAAGQAPQVSQPGDRSEREADNAAQQVTSGKTVSPGTITPMRKDEEKPVSTYRIQRQAAVAAPEAEAPTAQPAEKEAAAAPISRNPVGGAAAPGTPPPPPQSTGAGISLASPRFTLPAGWEDKFDKRGNADVPVYLGKLAAGTIKVHKSGQDYETPTLQAIPLNLPALAPLRGTKGEPVLAVKIKKSAITGYITVAGPGGKPAGNPQKVMRTIKEHSREFGWAGIDVGKLPEVKSELKEGTLTFQVTNFPFKLGGFLNGSADFELINEQVKFKGSANIQLGGVADSTMNIERMEDGTLKGDGEANISIAKFSGKLNAKFVGGIVDIEGKVGYKTEKLSGEVTLLVTDAVTANTLAEKQLGPEQIIASAKAAQTPAPDSDGPKPGPRKLAGYGTLDFAFTDWLAGKATVIIDGKGDVTVIGKIAPPAEKELFPQKDYAKQLIKLEVRAPYGVPVIGNIYLFANIGLIAEARIGPAKIYNIEINGVYSTDPKVLQKFDMGASFNMSAYAGLKLRGERGVGLEILSHDIKAGVGANATAGVKGYVDARPTIGYREKADPKEGKKGEFFIKGHMELAAQPFLGLSGDLFVELDSPWWSPAPDKKWTWPLGQLEYPLPGEFGLAADIDYVLGSQQIPEIKFSEAKFDSNKFMTDLMRENVPKKSKGEQDKPAKFTESPDTKAAPGKGAGKGAAGSAGGAKAGSGGLANQPAAKPTVQPGGKKKDKKPPSDPKLKAEGEKKKQELLKGGAKKPSEKDVKEAKQKEDPKVKSEKEHDAKLKAGLSALDALTQRYAKDGATKDELEAGVKSVRRKFKVFKSIQIKDGGDRWRYFYVASDGSLEGPKEKIVPKPHVTYGPLDSLKRPTGITAVLAKPLGKGSAANRNIRPPGFPPKGTTIHPYARAHLLGDQLGGSGKDKRNLVTFSQRKYNSGEMSKHEGRIRKAVENGEIVDYKVRPIYRGNDLIPIAINIEAKSIGKGTIDISFALANIIWEGE
ncbi:MAG: DNA/RNA non-specific endonuclease, partial [Anaerolineae bacterium]|nr:DNA/RNA non-specific endonuclease [Anaerolineae bacterium]